VPQRVCITTITQTVITNQHVKIVIINLNFEIFVVFELVLTGAARIATICTQRFTQVQVKTQSPQLITTATVSLATITIRPAPMKPNTASHTPMTEPWYSLVTLQPQVSPSVRFNNKQTKTIVSFLL